MEKLKDKEDYEKMGRLNSMRVQKNYLERQVDMRNSLKQIGRNEK